MLTCDLCRKELNELGRRRFYIPMFGELLVDGIGIGFREGTAPARQIYEENSSNAYVQFRRNAC